VPMRKRQGDSRACAFILRQHTAASIEQRSVVQKARIRASGRRPESEAADSRWKARLVQASEQASL
jgi:hypothetical protein